MNETTATPLIDQPLDQQSRAKLGAYLSSFPYSGGLLAELHRFRDGKADATLTDFLDVMEAFKVAVHKGIEDANARARELDELHRDVRGLRRIFYG